MGKYISKHIGQRAKQDLGARCVRFINFKPGTRRASSSFSWNSVNTWLWRQKLAEWARQNKVGNYACLRQRYGPRWAFFLQSAILATELPAGVLFPSLSHSDRNALQEAQARNIIVQAMRFLDGPTSRPFRINTKTYVKKAAHHSGV
jgi:hypothetical protein